MVVQKDYVQPFMLLVFLTTWWATRYDVQENLSDWRASGDVTMNYTDWPAPSDVTIILLNRRAQKAGCCESRGQQRGWGLKIISHRS